MLPDPATRPVLTAEELKWVVQDNVSRLYNLKLAA